MAEAKRDQNRIPTLIGVSSVDSETPINVAVNPSTGAVLSENSTPTTDQEVDIVEVGGTAISLGQKTMAASIPVVLPSNQSDVPIKESRAATSNVTSVADTATSTTLLASNANRLSVRIYNNSTAVLYVKFGTTASATDFTVQMNAEDYFEDYQYTGRIGGIWASDASGAALITETTT